MKTAVLVAAVCLLSCGQAELTITVDGASHTPVQIGQVRSLELWALSDPSFDGITPSCEELQSGRALPWQKSLARRPLFAQSADAVTIDNLPAQPVVFFVRLLSGDDGVGTVLGTGCSASTRIKRGETARVTLQVSR